MSRTSQVPAETAWTAHRFFELLGELGKLRVISVCGPSVFEAICEAGPVEQVGGFLNIITPAYHWHFAAHRFGHLRSVDTIHARSGRRVLFFELREQPDDDPFLRIYLFRPKDEDIEPQALARFGAVHQELEAGITVEKGEPA